MPTEVYDVLVERNNRHRLYLVEKNASGKNYSLFLFEQQENRWHPMAENSTLDVLFEYLTWRGIVTSSLLP